VAKKKALKLKVMDSLTSQLYAVEHGLGDLMAPIVQEEEKKETPKNFDWTAEETDSDEEDDSDQESPLDIKIKKNILKEKNEEEDSSSSSDEDDGDEDATGIDVNWLDDSDEEVEGDEEEEEKQHQQHKTQKTSSSSNDDKQSTARIVDLVPFFRSPKLHVRVAVATQVAGLSSTVEGRSLINSPLIMQHLCRLLGGDDKEAKPALQALINMCQLRLFKMNLAKMGIVKRLINSVLDSSQRNLRKLQCMLLSNVTQDSRGSRQLLDLDGESKGRPMGTTLRKLVNILLSSFPVNQQHDRSASCKSDSPHYLAHLLINVTQLQEGRNVLLDKETGVLVSLLPYFKSENEVLRQGIVGMLKNLCHELKFVSWLLSPKVDALGRTMCLLKSGKERDTSVLILAVDLLVVVVSTSQGKTVLREKSSVSTLCKIGSVLDKSSVPNSSKEKLIQVISIAQGKSEQIVLKRDVKPGDVVPV